MSRILVIDDDPLVCRVLVFALEALAPSVGTTSAREGLALLGDGSFDAVLCDADLGAGEASGHTVLREVARRWPRVRRYLMSGRPQPTDEVFFLKPLGLEQLRRVAGIDDA